MHKNYNISRVGGLRVPMFLSRNVQKCVFGSGSAADPAGGAFSGAQTLTELWGLFLKEGEVQSTSKGMEGKRCKRWESQQ